MLFALVAPPYAHHPGPPPSLAVTLAWALLIGLPLWFVTRAALRKVRDKERRDLEEMRRAKPAVEAREQDAQREDRAGPYRG